MRTVLKSQYRLPEKYAELTPVFNDFLTKIMAQFDLRNANTEFAGGLKYDGTKIQIGDSTSQTCDINAGAKATTQKVMPIINWANAGSVQSAIPLSASADATSATINIAAHDVIYGGETVSYNAGMVVGAPVSSPVHIFADDPLIQGGAVTYEFTTDYTELAESRHRYRVGAIVTPVSSISAAVSAATNANPCLVTTGAAHGFTTLDAVDFVSVGGMTELNTGTYTVTVVSPTTFTIGVNSTAFGVYTAGGTVTRVSTPALGLGGAGGGTEIYDPAFFT